MLLVFGVIGLENWQQLGDLKMRLGDRFFDYSFLALGAAIALGFGGIAGGLGGILFFSIPLLVALFYVAS